MTTNNQKVTLYIATHNKTGLKYFGKTTKYFSEEDLHKYYHGSGVYWKDHLKVHNDDVTMEIYGIYSLDEVKEIALKFSKDNNIVKALNENGKKIWANEKPENGLDGGGTFIKGVNKGTKNVINKEGKIIKVSVSNKKFVHINKGKIVVKDKSGNVLQVSVDDNRFKQGDLIHINSGLITMYDVIAENGVKISRKEYDNDRRYIQFNTKDLWVFKGKPYRVKDLHELNLTKYIAIKHHKNKMVTRTEYKLSL